MADVKPIPDGYQQVTPYLCVDGADAAIQFYATVFGTTERMRMPSPDGKVAHAEIALGDSVIMLSDEMPGMGTTSPGTVGGSPVVISLYVEDVDSVYELAVQNGGTDVQPVKDEFYGDRSFGFQDPFGHRWNVATHVEDVPPEEMGKRAAEAMGGG